MKQINKSILKINKESEFKTNKSWQNQNKSIQNKPIMISDNMNVENRNSGVYIPSNRINNLRSIARSRCCSFCRQSGHTINSCNDERLQDFEIECIERKIMFETTYEPTSMFNQWLTNKLLDSPVIVKSFAIRKCGSTLRSTVQECIDSIKNYIYNVYNEETNTDYIPFRNEYNHSLITENSFHAILGLLNLTEYRNEIIQEMSIKTIKIQYLETKEDETKEDYDCDCSICFENYKKDDFVKLNCGHEFCGNCVLETVKNSSLLARCALCRADINMIHVYSKEVEDKFK